MAPAEGAILMAPSFKKQMAPSSEIVLGWAVLCWARLSWAVMGWAVLVCAGLGCAELGWAGLC